MQQPLEEELLPMSPRSPIETSPLVQQQQRQSALPAGAGRTSASSSQGENRRSSASSEQYHSGSSDNGATYSISSHQQQNQRPPYSSSRESSSSAIAPANRASGAFDDLTPELLGLSGGQVGANYSRYSSVPPRGSAIGLSGFADPNDVEETNYILPSRGSYLPYGGADSPGSRASMASFSQNQMAQAATTDALLWDEKNQEVDDYLHNPDPEEYKGRKVPPGMFPVLNSSRRSKSEFRLLSLRGMTNWLGLVIVLGGLVGIFAFWPMATAIKAMQNHVPLMGWNVGGTNASGQVPEIPNFPALIDESTPQSARTYQGNDGRDYVLVFSDEFNTDGRTFWPGDDPFWEGQDLHYWGTVNYEWRVFIILDDGYKSKKDGRCDPDALTTKDGNLEITMSEQPIHGLNFRSGFLSSWNKFCFNKDAYVELNVSLPGNARAMGLWPGLWSMGNLGRAGFGATNDGTWPYSYDSCDAGTLPNQTYPNGTAPVAAKTSGSTDYGGELSYLPGQRLSACTCKGDDHPGPSHDVGRAAPEIDILEAQVDWRGYGTASQSVQIAPFDDGYYWDNSTNGWTQHSPQTFLNDWKGSITQESASAVTTLDATSYDGAGYQTFGYELHAGKDDGYVTWTVNGQPSWTLKSGAFAPNPTTDVGHRLISEEPMYLLLNLFISSKFQGNPDFGNLVFPAIFRIDYVRVYQPKGTTNLGCDPSSHPTAKYIQDHLVAYTNPNATTWDQAAALAKGTSEETHYQWPRNRLWTGGCDTERQGP